MRVTRDQRGYETTFLLHASRPGERPRVLYWYRSAPGVRVGRRALDEDAIRALEEQHPDIEFDWPTLIEETESTPVEVDRRPERPRRKPQRPPEPSTATVDFAEMLPSGGVDVAPEVPPRVEAPPPPPRAVDAGAAKNMLLDQLVGREIASRLRGRYAEVAARLAELPDDAARQAWQDRADRLDPDRWNSPQAILEGVQHADRLFDELKHELGI
jgi:hypothetical protein